MNKTERFTWPEGTLGSSVLDDDSREVAFVTGVPSGLGLGFLRSPENHKQSSTGREYAVIARHRQSPFELAIDRNGAISGSTARPVDLCQ